VSRLTEVISLFLKLGFTAFGGPAAHVSLMHDEVVKRRQWVTDQEFLDLLGATNLIPGPNSTEMAIHLGFRRAGWPGLIAGGVCFALPAALIVGVLAYFYKAYGNLPQAAWILQGVTPVVLAVILQALWNLGKKAVRTPLLFLAAALVFGLYFLGVNEVLLLFVGGLAVMLIENISRLKKPAPAAVLLPLSLAVPALASAPFSLTTLFLVFLKVGSILYGSGYVLLAFLRSDLVVRLGWLTDQQLLDAIAVGQVTPGPLFTTSTFIGYFLGGVPGAVLATLGIFLPSFLFVALSSPLIPKMRSSPWAGALLDGVNAVSLGLMAAVTAQIGRAAMIDVWSVLIAVVSAVLLLKYKLNSTWLIAGGALIGVVRAVVGE
jgi:chromate transporter